MYKQEFLDALRLRLSGLPQDDVDGCLAFYSEAIDDRIEEGLSEEDAVSQMGSLDGIIEQVVADIPLTRIAKERIGSRRRLKAWEIVLLAVGSPIWLSLLIAAFAVILSLYAVLWSVIISLWAVFGAFVGCSVGGVVGGILFAVGGHVPVGIALVGCGITLGGLSILTFFGCMAATKGVLILTKKIAVWIKSCFIGREGA